MGDTHGGWSGCASGLSSLEETKSTSQCPHGCHRGGQGEGPSLNGQRPSSYERLVLGFCGRWGKWGTELPDFAPGRVRTGGGE